MEHIYAFFFQLPFLPERLLAAGNSRAIREIFTGRMAGRHICDAEGG